MHYPISAYQHNALHKYGYGNTTAILHRHEPGGQLHYPEIPISPKKKKGKGKQFMAHRGGYLTRYRGFGSIEEGVEVMGQEAESLLVQAKQQVEDAGSGVIHAMEDVATRQRQRQAVYMVAAPLIVFSGLTNRRYRSVGFAAALAGALIGFRHYNEYKKIHDLRKQVGLDGDGYGVPGRKILYPAGCSPMPKGVRGCPPGHSLHVMSGVRVCCRRPMYLKRSQMRSK